MSRKTLILDSSQISAWLECPEKHNLEYVENLAVSNEISKPLAAGSYGHKLLEIYYRWRDLDQPQAIKKALAFDPGKEFPLDQETEQLVKSRFNLYCMTYNGKDIKPLTKSVHKISIQNGLPIDTQTEEPLVEQGFSYELLNTREYLFVLEGRIDLIGTMSGSNLFMDHKWQFRERELYEKSIQFRNYSLVTNCTLGIINYIGLQKSVTDRTFRRQVINFNAQMRSEWHEELTEIFIRIANSNHHERRWNSCEGKFGYHCQFTPICEVYKQPSSLVQVMKSRYVKREEWRPW